MDNTNYPENKFREEFMKEHDKRNKEQAAIFKAAKDSATNDK